MHRRSVHDPQPEGSVRGGFGGAVPGRHAPVLSARVGALGGARHSGAVSAARGGGAGARGSPGALDLARELAGQSARGDRHGGAAGASGVDAGARANRLCGAAGAGRGGALAPGVSAIPPGDAEQAIEKALEMLGTPSAKTGTEGGDAGAEEAESTAAASTKKRHADGSEKQDAAAAEPDPESIDRAGDWLIEQLIELRTHHYHVMADCFDNHDAFRAELRSAFETVANASLGTLSVVELLTGYVDRLLRSSGSSGGGAAANRLSEEEAQAQFRRITAFLEHMHNKDVFAEFYRNYLYKRLLFGKSVSEELEHAFRDRPRERRVLRARFLGDGAELGLVAVLPKRLRAAAAVPAGGVGGHFQDVLRVEAPAPLPPVVPLAGHRRGGMFARRLSGHALVRKGGRGAQHLPDVRAAAVRGERLAHLRADTERAQRHHPGAGDATEAVRTLAVHPQIPLPHQDASGGAGQTDRRVPAEPRVRARPAPHPHPGLAEQHQQRGARPQTAHASAADGRDQPTDHGHLQTGPAPDQGAHRGLDPARIPRTRRQQHLALPLHRLVPGHKSGWEDREEGASVESLKRPQCGPVDEPREGNGRSGVAFRFEFRASPPDFRRTRAARLARARVVAAAGSGMEGGVGVSGSAVDQQTAAQHVPTECAAAIGAGGARIGLPAGVAYTTAATGRVPGSCCCAQFSTPSGGSGVVGAVAVGQTTGVHPGRRRHVVAVGMRYVGGATATHPGDFTRCCQCGGTERGRHFTDVLAQFVRLGRRTSVGGHAVAYVAGSAAGAAVARRRRRRSVSGALSGQHQRCSGGHPGMRRAGESGSATDTGAAAGHRRGGAIVASQRRRRRTLGHLRAARRRPGCRRRGCRGPGADRHRLSAPASVAAAPPGHCSEPARGGWHAAVVDGDHRAQGRRHQTGHRRPGRTAAGGAGHGARALANAGPHRPRPRHLGQHRRALPATRSRAATGGGAAGPDALWPPSLPSMTLSLLFGVRRRWLLLRSFPSMQHRRHQRGRQNNRAAQHTLPPQPFAQKRHRQRRRKQRLRGQYHAALTRRHRLLTLGLRIPGKRRHQ
eukprot:ctg_1348.g494